MTNLTTTLEKSKELRDADFKQQTKLYYNSETGKLQLGFTSHVDSEGLMCWSISAVTITELLEELDNNFLRNYFVDSQMDTSEIIDLFRSPDKLADCWLWAKQQNLLGRDKERMK